MKTLILFLTGCLLTATTLIGQELPKVFMLGEHEEAFEQLSAKHADMLLSVCGDDMQLAYQQWQDVLVKMEEQADAMEIDLKGGKFWFNIFWSPNGKIEHIAYYLKPNSRNMDLEELQLFLTYFVNSYKMPLSYNKPFSHYGSASFPMLPILTSDTAKKKPTRELAKDNDTSTRNE